MTIDFPDINDVNPLNENDNTCIKELRDVLEKHGMLDRFGLTLLHDHFPINEQEVLVEVCDIEARTLTSKPVKKTDLEKRVTVETSWHLRTGEVLTACRAKCVYDPNKNEHHKDHWLS